MFLIGLPWSGKYKKKQSYREENLSRWFIIRQICKMVFNSLNGIRGSVRELVWDPLEPSTAVVDMPELNDYKVS